MENKQITEILRVFRITVGKDMSDIESISTGSFHKTKEEILNYATSQARSAKRYAYLIASCLESLNEGETFQQWIDRKFDNINRNNQCQQDKDDAMEDLNRLSEEAINL